MYKRQSISALLDATSIAAIDVSSNNFVFDDLIPVGAMMSDLTVGSFVYSPQAVISLPTSVTAIGGALQISSEFSPSMLGDDNYSWFHDNIAINSVVSETLTRTDVTAADTGDYRYEINNSALAELTLMSGDVSVTVDFDGDGSPDSCLLYTSPSPRD